MAQRDDSLESNRTHPLQLIFFIIIPLILAVSITMIVFSLLDVNPIGKAKEFANHIPVINNFITTEEESEIERQIEQYQNQISSLKSEVTTLESELVVSTTEVEQLSQEITRLNYQIEQLNELLYSDTQSEENLAKLAVTYEAMAPDTAALIISTMSQANALSILREIDNAQQAAILSQMEPEDAARITEQLLN